MVLQIVKFQVSSEVFHDLDYLFGDAPGVKSLFTLCGQRSEGLCQSRVPEYFTRARRSHAVFCRGVLLEHLCIVGRGTAQELFLSLPLLFTELSTAEPLNGIDPTGCGAGNCCSVYVVCWDLADFAIGDLETFADGLKSLFGT
ncbi:hypothetical protein HG530_000390 [Fusarium avenaceum]|nr:hypothetical protein HG530_000390 [Fusarium avenaceum]